MKKTIKFSIEPPIFKKPWNFILNVLIIQWNFEKFQKLKVSKEKPQKLP